LSARVVQPGSGEEIVAVRTAAAEDRLLDGVEKLSHEVRHRLGERQEAIRQSEPLPKVTTRSLEALKLYAQATEANRRYNFEQAYELVTQAIRLDSTFAAAYRAAAVYSGNRGHLAEAVRYAARAYELRDGLTERERLLTEATYYAHVEMDFRRAVNAYEVMLSRYPDWGTAALNLAVYAAIALGERERAYQASLRAVELAPYSALAYGQVIANARWTDRWEIADSVIQVAREVGFEEQAADWSLGQALGRREWARADFLCDSLLVASTAAPRTANLRARCGILDIARGRMQRGIERELAVVAYRTESGDRYLSGSPFLNALLAEAMRGHDAAARALFEQGFAVIEPETMAEPERFFSRQTVQVIAYLLEMPDMAETMEEIIPPFPDSEHPVSRMGQLLTEAARALYEGESERTVELLRRMRAIGYAGGWVPFADLMSGLAFERLGEPDSAVAYLERVIEPVRLAGWAFCRLQLPMIELRLARLEESRGDAEAAIRHYRHFLELWAEPDPELQDEVETSRLAVALLADRETI